MQIIYFKIVNGVGATGGGQALDRRRPGAKFRRCSSYVNCAACMTSIRPLALALVLVFPPPRGTTLVPVPRAGACAQGLLQGQGALETLARALGQAS
jgi:hypothetical protein